MVKYKIVFFTTEEKPFLYFILILWLIAIICTLSSCVSYNDYCTEKWIKENKKPITVKQYKAKQFNAYILYSDTNDFDTGLTSLILEDTIK